MPCYATLKILELKIKTYIGIHDWEKEIQQTILIDLEFKLDLDRVTEDINSTIDYAAVSQLIYSKISNMQFHLIETVVKYIKQLLLDTYNITPYCIRIHKPYAISKAKCILIELIEQPS